MNSEKLVDLLDKLDIKVPLGTLLFNITLDKGFFGMAPELDTQRHNHSSYEVHFISGGSGTLHVENRDIALVQGNYYIIGPSVYHALSSKPDNPVQKYYMKFDYHRVRNLSYAKFSDTDAESVNNTLSGIRFFSSPDVFNTIPLLKKIYAELENRSICYYSRIQGYFTLLLTDIVRAISPGNSQNSGIPLKVKDELRSDIIEHFFDDYYSNLTMDDLANTLNLSNSQLNRVLKQLYNTSFKQKLLDTRIEVSKDLLKHSNLPVDTISDRVGYISVRNFQAIFKKKVGLSAGMYREFFKTQNDRDV